MVHRSCTLFLVLASLILGQTTQGPTLLYRNYSTAPSFVGAVAGMGDIDLDGYDDVAHMGPWGDV
jgi:hypothetical protein